MKTKTVYVAPATYMHSLASQKLLQGVSGKLNGSFISNPGVGEAESGDVIGTESRTTSYELWDE